MQTTKTTNYRIASLRGGTIKSKVPKCKLPKIPTIELLLEDWWEGNYQKQTIESLSEGGGGKLPKTIEHMSEIKFTDIFHKSCINCKNWSCTSSC